MTRTNSGAAWLKQARQQLRASSDQPSLEAQALLAHVLSRPRAWLLAHPDFHLSDNQLECLQRLLDQRSRGEPLPYLLGHWEFFGIDFIVTGDVLIPRPETELLVEEALAWINGRSWVRQAVDVGTGSGCIATSLARHSPDVRVLATDLSRSALRIACQNIGRYGLQERVSLLQCDLVDGCAGPFDLVCANLPYIPSAILPGLEVARHEPLMALDGGPNGLSLIERLLIQAAPRMAAGGLLLFEIEAGQGETALDLASQLYPNANSIILNDLAGKPRLLRIETTH